METIAPVKEGPDCWPIPGPEKRVLAGQALTFKGRSDAAPCLFRHAQAARDLSLAGVKPLAPDGHIAGPRARHCGATGFRSALLGLGQRRESLRIENPEPGPLLLLANL